MQVDIFYLNDNKESCDYLLELLDEVFEKGLEINKCVINREFIEKRSDKDEDNARKYISQLNMSMVKSEKFSMLVKKSTNWGYWGNYGREECFCKFLEITSEQFAYWFPAISIWGRMVLAPKYLMDKFSEHSQDFPVLFRPLSFNGIRLVDFKNREEVINVLFRLKYDILEELLGLCDSQISMQGGGEVNIRELGKILNVSKRFLDYHLKDRLKPLGKVDVVFPAQELYVNVENLIVLEVFNNSETDLYDVKVCVRTPEGDEGLKWFINVDNNAKEQITFKVKPKTVPYFPIEVSLSAGDKREEGLGKYKYESTKKILPVTRIEALLLKVRGIPEMII